MADTRMNEARQLYIMGPATAGTGRLGQEVAAGPSTLHLHFSSQNHDLFQDSFSVYEAWDGMVW